MLGPIEVDISSDSAGEKLKTKTIAQLANNVSDDTAPLDTSEREFVKEQNIDTNEINVHDIRLRLKEEKKEEMQRYKLHVMRASPAAKLIVKYWLLRSNFLRKLRTQCNSYIRSQLETEC